MEEKAEAARWRLKRGDDALAELEEQYADFPWVECAFRPGPEFERFRHYFDRSVGGWRDRAKERHQAIRLEGIYMETAEGKVLKAFTLVLENSAARLTFNEV